MPARTLKRQRLDEHPSKDKDNRSLASLKMTLNGRSFDTGDSELELPDPYPQQRSDLAASGHGDNETENRANKR